MGSPKPSYTIVQPPPPTVTQLPPPQPFPPSTVAENSRQLAQSQLEFNPQLTAQQVQLQGQYGPQLAQQQYNLQSQYGPMYEALYRQLFPNQTQGLDTLAQQALQRLTQPFNLTPEQQSAQDAIRNREQNRLLQGIRSRANVGGTLYGGNEVQMEQQGLAELANQYALSDIGLQQQNRDQNLRELIASGQVIFPQVQQPNVPGFGQGVTPSPDALLQAILGQQFVQPAAIGFGQSPRAQNFGLFSGLAQGVGNAICHVAEVLYGAEDPRTWLARLYVGSHDTWFLHLYRRFSQTWARWLRRVPILQPFVQPIWDRMHRQMRTELPRIA